MAKLRTKERVEHLVLRTIKLTGEFIGLFYLSVLDAHKKLRKLKKVSSKASLENQASYITGYEANSASIDEFERLSITNTKEKT